MTQAAETEGSEGATPPPSQPVQRPDCHGIMNMYLAGHPEESAGVVMKRAVWFYLPLTEKHVCDIKTVRANGTYGRFALSEKAYRVNREALLLVEQEAAWATYGNMSDESAEILRKMPPRQEIEVALWPSENIPVSTYDTTSGSAFEQALSEHEERILQVHIRAAEKAQTLGLTYTPLSASVPIGTVKASARDLLEARFVRDFGWIYLAAGREMLQASIPIQGGPEAEQLTWYQSLGITNVHEMGYRGSGVSVAVSESIRESTVPDDVPDGIIPDRTIQSGCSITNSGEGHHLFRALRTITRKMPDVWTIPVPNGVAPDVEMWIGCAPSKDGPSWLAAHMNLGERINVLSRSEGAELSQLPNRLDYSLVSRFLDFESCCNPKSRLLYVASAGNYCDHGIDIAPDFYAEHDLAGQPSCTVSNRPRNGLVIGLSDNRSTVDRADDITEIPRLSEIREPIQVPKQTTLVTDFAHVNPGVGTRGGDFEVPHLAVPNNIPYGHGVSWEFTSAAAPAAAGVAALIMSISGNQSIPGALKKQPEAVRAILFAGANWNPDYLCLTLGSSALPYTNLCYGTADGRRQLDAFRAQWLRLTGTSIYPQQDFTYFQIPGILEKRNTEHQFYYAAGAEPLDRRTGVGEVNAQASAEIALQGPLQGGEPQCTGWSSFAVHQEKEDGSIMGVPSLLIKCDQDVTRLRVALTWSQATSCLFGACEDGTIVDGHTRPDFDLHLWQVDPQGGPDTWYTSSVGAEGTYEFIETTLPQDVTLRIKVLSVGSGWSNTRAAVAWWASDH